MFFCYANLYVFEIVLIKFVKTEGATEDSLYNVSVKFCQCKMINYLLDSSAYSIHTNIVLHKCNGNWTKCWNATKNMFLHKKCKCNAFLGK